MADLNIHVKRGRIYGLLGRNGAGKTTTMKMLLGLTKPTSGEVKIWGKSLQGNEKKLLPRIGSLIESPGFYPNLTGTENLNIFARLRGVPQKNAVAAALEVVELPYRDKKLFSQYSLGMKQRLAIALAIMHDPELLSPHELYERKVTMQELHAAISSLPDKQAKRIYAHFILGMTKQDIARAEGVHEKVVRVAIERGLRRLEKILKNSL